MNGLVDAVCIVYQDQELRTLSAIDKRAVDKTVYINTLGLQGDYVLDTKRHGGIEQAVYAYAQSEAEAWEQELGKSLPHGWFGENLRLSGMPVTDLLIGQILQCGNNGAILAATIPREPCQNFAVWSQEPQWIKRFAAKTHTGAYFQVLRPGNVSAGDSIHFLNTPPHSIRIRDLFYATPITIDKAQEMQKILAGSLEIENTLSPKTRRMMEQKVKQTLS